MGISIWQLLIVLAIVLLLFGAKRLRNVGGDLGGAIKGFKKAMKDGDDAKGNGMLDDNRIDKQVEGEIIEGEVTDKDNEKV